MGGRFKEGQGFKDLVGQRFGLLTVLEYIGRDKHKRSKWSCLCDCGGNTEAFGAEMKTGTVKCCGCTHTKKRPKRVDKEEFLNRAYIVHGNKYDYSKMDYKNTTTAIEIVCRKHNSFWQTPTQHYIKGQGCPHCAWEAKADKYRYDTTRFIEEALVRNGGNFDYKLVDYIDSKTYVSIICNTCSHIFEQSPSAHLAGHGCPKCANAAKTVNLTLTTEDYVRKAVAVHGSELYCYKHTEYNYCKGYISILCNTCENQFSMRADVHLGGCGCPCKSTRGFDFTKQGILYVLSCGDMTKVGITSHSAEKRASEVSSSFGSEFSVVKSFGVENPRVCSDAETLLLRELRRKYKQPINKFDGYTECFFSVDIPHLYSRIETILGELNDRN